jgi:iron complex transport system permease protein
MSDVSTQIVPSPPPHPLLRRVIGTTAALLLVLAATLIVAANIGYQHIPLAEVLRALARRGVSPQTETILWSIRLPRVALGAAVGFALSVAGATFQGLLRNPLADPYLIGVSSGAAVGATAAILLHWEGAAGGFGVPALAFLAALITMVIVYWLAHRRGRLTIEGFILAGVVVGSFMWAAVTLMMSIAGRDLSEVVRWLMGNLAVDRWASVGLTAGIAAVGGLGIYAYARDLNLLVLGEESAKQMGVEVEGLKRVIIVLGSLVTAAAVCFSGIIGFVGLVIPHIARRIVGPDHRVLLPAAGLIGASFLVLADALARVVLGTGELPVGVITAILGAPFFCYLLRRGRSQAQ